MSDARYAARGVSAGKEEVHAAIEGIDKGLFPRAFCKIVPDHLTGSEEHCVVMHADGAGPTRDHSQSTPSLTTTLASLAAPSAQDGALFSLAKHINYTGEILTFVGWVALTQRRVALAVPLGFSVALCCVYAPDLDGYVRKRYGGDARFSEWCALPSFVPRTASSVLIGTITAAVVVILCLGGQ